MDELDRSNTNEGALGDLAFQTEWIVEDRDFEPCETIDFRTGRCGETRRVIRYVPEGPHKGLFCFKGHHCKYGEKEWIAAYEFEPGGDFCGILPEELEPTEEELKQKRWHLGENFKERFRTKHTVCAHPMCKKPPLSGWQKCPPDEIFVWLQEHAADLHAKIVAELRAVQGLDFSKWTVALSTELRAEVIDRLNKSILNIDHGVPRKRGNQIWRGLSRPARLFFRENLVFHLCRKCNGNKSAKLLPRDQIIDMYVEYHYESLAAAKADVVRWRLLLEILDAAYKEEAA